MLCEKKRILPQDSLDELMRQALERGPIQEAPLTHEVALETRLIRSEHRDPVDRFLAATARVFDLTLVTADRRLLNTSGFSKLANR